MPINYKVYPPNWISEIRPAVLLRAGDCCEWEGCGVKNYSMGYRDEQRFFHEVSSEELNDPMFTRAHKVFKIVLTVAHLDHDESNHDVKIDRLAAFCQLHHLRYDAPEKARRRKAKNK